MDGPTLLAAYLEKNKLSLRGFASKVDAPVALVWRWTKPGEGKPGIEYAFAIESATRGAVPAKAWRGVVAGAARRQSRRPTDRSS